MDHNGVKQQIWEYTTYDLTKQKREIEDLGRLGRDGWEAVAIVSSWGVGTPTAGPRDPIPPRYDDWVVAPCSSTGTVLPLSDTSRRNRYPADRASSAGANIARRPPATCALVRAAHVQTLAERSIDEGSDVRRVLGSR